MNGHYVLALSTFPDAETAAKVARELVTGRFIACANLMPSVQSFYLWKDKLEESGEVLALFKLTADRYSEFETRLHALHPYDVPEIIRLDISAGSADYLRWIGESCALQ